MMKNKLFSATGLVFVGLFLLVSVAVISLVPRMRMDLTADKLYTLADGTRNIVSGLEKPVELMFFYSEDATEDVPQLRTYGTRVQELLREMVIASNGNLRLRIIDPIPFSEEQDLAGEYGVLPVPLSQGGEEVFFGLVALDPSTVPPAGEEPAADAPERIFETIPLIRPEQEEFLEYEFSKLITQVANPEPPIVGFISGLPIDGGINPTTGTPIAPLMIMDSIRQLYTVQRVPVDAEEIDENISILLVVHPQELSQRTLYAIDQHVLRGGKTLVLLDPNADSQALPGMDGVPRPVENMASDLEPLLSAWGVEYDSEMILADQEQALLVTVGDAPRPIAHYGMLGIQRSGMTSDMVNTGLQVMNFSSVGALMPAEGASTTFDPLIQSSTSSDLLSALFVKDLTDPTILIDEFESDDRRYAIAARVSGQVQTAFPDGQPAAEVSEEESTDAVADAQAGDEPADETEAAIEEPAPAPVDMSRHLAESTGVVNLIIVADTDFLSNRLWVQVQNFLGQRVGQAFASNGDFMMNALDNLSGNPELVTIRSRGRYARPFTKVLDLQREADVRLREEETELLEALQQTEAQIAALRAGQQGNEVTPEQQAEVDRFYEQQLETRRRLREVQLQLNRDIENLGATLKFVNTALVPIALIVIALLLTLLRNRRRAARVAG